MNQIELTYNVINIRISKLRLYLFLSQFFFSIKLFTANVSLN